MKTAGNGGKTATNVRTQRKGKVEVTTVEDMQNIAKSFEEVFPQMSPIEIVELEEEAKTKDET